jgi:hypothetical protein
MSDINKGNKDHADGPFSLRNTSFIHSVEFLGGRPPLPLPGLNIHHFSVNLSF